jgi:ribulose-phosphate 3-epimerase
MLKCSTSLWSADLTNLAHEMKRVEPHSERFHLDVADGHYVKTMLFFPDLVKALRPHSKIPFEVHLMVADPMAWIEPFADADADIIIFCIDSVKNPVEVLRAIHGRGKKAGVSLLVKESIDLIEPLWKELDILTLFGSDPGVKGAAMDPSILEKIRVARDIIFQRSLPVELEADGGIRRETVPLLKASGVDFIVPGSLIFNENPRKMREWLDDL